MPPESAGPDTAARLRARREALERFATWEARQSFAIEPAVALAAATALYELLPSASRMRPVDAAGVLAMHRALAVAFGRS